LDHFGAGLLSEAYIAGDLVRLFVVQGGQDSLTIIHGFFLPKTKSCYCYGVQTLQGLLPAFIASSLVL
jgi:hypothetical protein